MPSPEPSAAPTAVSALRSLAPAAIEPSGRHGLIDLSHLDFLTEPVVVEGQPMALVHIYSETPHYRWVDASGEGISAVDDVARAAIVYLEVFERHGDAAALERARLLLEFVMHLQTEDGDYFNFVTDRDGTINRQGATSYEDWGWWAARGQWALAVGIRVFRDVDTAYAQRLRERYLLGQAALERALGSVGQYTELHGVRIPGWLLKGGTDVSSLALLGLAEFHAIEPNQTTAALAFALGQAVAEYRLGTSVEYPFGLRPSTAGSTAYWHAWGSHTVQALARAGDVFDRPDWVDGARREADLWFARLMTTGMIREVGVVPRRYDQIAYAQAMIVLGYWNLWLATEEEGYRRLAGLAAAWYFGDNPAGVAMYDVETGRGFDGVLGANPFRVNRNAGAESTIEALMALLAVSDDPVASRYIRAEPVEVTTPIILEAEAGEVVSGKPRFGQQDWTGDAYYSRGGYYALGSGDTVEVRVRLEVPGRYDLYVAHLRQALQTRDLTVEAAQAPDAMRIDGALDEWGATERAPVDSTLNILRGASAWAGPKNDSFEARFLWDDESLYVATGVRDPEHVQQQVGPGVWQGDTIWIYLDTTGAGDRIDAKLTVAQTPAGPQIWNWVSEATLPDATLAWAQGQDGYVYEAAIPWSSLNRQAPRAGEAIRFEIGRGFPGGFMDWTGTDPDTVGNLAPLHFVEAVSPSPGATPAPVDRGTDSSALGVTLDGSPVVTIPAITAPDRSYLWLESAAADVDLIAGDHEVTLTYAGSDPDGESVVDAVVLHPAIATKYWRLPDGRGLTLEFRTANGSLQWQED